MRRAVTLGGFILRPFRTFQSVSQVSALGGELGHGFLQALAVGLQICYGFDLVVDQKLRYGDVSVQLENVLPQEVGRPFDTLGVVLDRTQQNAILEVQGPEAGELFRRLPGYFVSVLPDQDTLHGLRLSEGRGAAGVLVDALPDALQGIILAQGVEIIVLTRVGWVEASEPPA